MKVLEYTVIALGVLLAALGAFLLFATLRDYNPPPVVTLEIENGKALDVGTPTDLTLMTWNIGYAGLGENEDFFLDGGKEVRPPLERARIYLNGILSFVASKKGGVDVFMFQEVDRDSDRSYHVDQYEKLAEVLSDYYRVFATNYLVDFVPVPPTDPMGRVYSGIAVFSRYRPISAKRYALPGQYPWPERVFHLDRCMVVLRLPAPNGKEWVLINTHNSAYDEGGILRKKQLDFIKGFIEREYSRGNYVVVGGDWNAILGGNFRYTEERPAFYVPLPKGWTPKGWKWAIDTAVPTNRSVSSPYREGENFVTVIDGFLVSPNVEVEYVEGQDLHFKYSDHNPVIVKVRAVF